MVALSLFAFGSHLSLVAIAGGYSDIALLNEMYSLDPTTDNFVLVNPLVTAPPALAYHSLVVVHHTALVFGGEKSDGSFSNAVWALDMMSLRDRKSVV